MSSQSQMPIKNKNIVIREEQFGGVCYIRPKLGGGFIRNKFILNHMAKDILNLCDGTHDIKDIVEAIALKYNIKDKELLYQDIETFLRELESLSVISWKGTKLRDIQKKYTYLQPNMVIPLSSPFSIHWNITNFCNLNCRHCYTIDRRTGKELTTEKALKVVEEIIDANVLEVTFSGGEPLLRKDLFTLAKTLYDNGVSVFLTTNGTLIDKNVAEKLEECGITYMQVSLDGAKPETHDKFRGVPGAFRRTMNGLKAIAEYTDILVNIATVPTKENFHEIPDILNIAIELGFNYRILECKPLGRGKNIQEQLLGPKEYRELLEFILKKREELKETKTKIFLSECFAFLVDERFSKSPNKPLIDCPAARSLCAIDADGNVSPCSYFSFLGISVGNIRHQSLTEIWRSSWFFNELRKIDFSNPMYSPQECSSCKYKNVCGRGCRALAFYAYYNLLAPDPRCSVYKKYAKVVESENL